jgi:hypothetical protein
VFLYLYLTINIFTVSLRQVVVTRVYYFSIHFSLFASHFLHNNFPLQVFSFFSAQMDPFPRNYVSGGSKAFCWNARYYECATGMCGIVRGGFQYVHRRLPLMSSSAKADTNIYICPFLYMCSSRKKIFAFDLLGCVLFEVVTTVNIETTLY